jgi:hypothetical protein
MADSQRDKLVELILNAPKISCIKGGQATGKQYQTFQNIADHLLANGVILQKQGKWKIKRDDCDFEYMMCSCCKEEFFPEGCVVEITPNFCPNCGAKMKECEGK